MNFHKSPIRNLAISPDGRTLATAGYDKIIKLWEAKSLKWIRDLKGHKDIIESVSFSKDSQSLFSSSSDFTVGQWDVATGQFKHSYWGHEDDVVWSDSSPCGHFLVSCSYDESIILWHKEGRPKERIFCHEGTINEVKFGPDGNFFASVGNDKKLRVFTSEDGKEVASYIFNCDLNSLVWIKGQEIRIVGDDGLCYTVNLKTKKITSFVAHKASIRRLSYCEKKDLLAIGSYDKKISLWQAKTNQLIKSVAGGRKWENGVALAPDGTALFVASTDGHFRAYDLPHLKEIQTPLAETHGLNTLDISEALMATGADDHSIGL